MRNPYKARGPVRYTCCPRFEGEPHGEACPAVAALQRDDAEHRAYLESTPEAWENTHGR